MDVVTDDGWAGGTNIILETPYERNIYSTSKPADRTITCSRWRAALRVLRRGAGHYQSADVRHFVEMLQDGYKGSWSLLGGVQDKWWLRRLDMTSRTRARPVAGGRLVHLV
jgi:hypothetical protein